MGVDTNVELIGHVSSESVLNFIKQRIDSNAKCRIRHETWDKKISASEKENYMCDYGYIDFKSSSGECRGIFYQWSNSIDHGNDTYYKEYGLEELCNTETTYLSMRCDDEAKTILRMIVEEFGGWIDYDDCDDEPYELVVKNPDGSVKPVIHVTLEEVYEKFGCAVIIDK